MDEQTQVHAPVDEPAKQDAPAKGKCLDFIKKLKFNAWQSIFILVCIGSAASMIFWAASYDLLS